MSRHGAVPPVPLPVEDEPVAEPFVPIEPEVAAGVAFAEPADEVPLRLLLPDVPVDDEGIDEDGPIGEDGIAEDDPIDDDPIDDPLPAFRPDEPDVPPAGEEPAPPVVPPACASNAAGASASVAAIMSLYIDSLLFFSFV